MSVSPPRRVGCHIDRGTGPLSSSLSELLPSTFLSELRRLRSQELHLVSGIEKIAMDGRRESSFFLHFRFRVATSCLTTPHVRAERGISTSIQYGLSTRPPRDTFHAILARYDQKKASEWEKSIISTIIPPASVNDGIKKADNSRLPNRIDVSAWGISESRIWTV